MTTRVDFTNQAFFRDPAGGIERLRALGPVVATRFPIVGKVWITTTYESTARVLKDSETFTLRREGGGVAGLRWWMPALVSARAGVTEQYPKELQAMILPDPDDAHDLACRLRCWRKDIDHWRSAFQILSDCMRRRTWKHMAAEIVALAEGLDDVASLPTKVSPIPAAISSVALADF